MSSTDTKQATDDMATAGPPSPLPQRPQTAVGALIGTLRSNSASAGAQVVAFLGFLALGIGIGLVLGWSTGHSPALILGDLVKGSVGDATSIGYTLTAAAPLLLVAVGAVIGMRAGQFNIGQEGQVTLGAIGAGLVVFHLDGPTLVIVPTAVLAAMIGGAIWAGLAAAFKFGRGVDIVVSSLLLVFLAEQLLVAMISGHGPLHDDGQGTLGSAAASQSPRVPADAMISGIGIFGVEVPYGFLLAAVIALIAALVLRFTVVGYRLRILGHNPTIARTLGVREGWLGSGAVMVSGACAGIAGALLLLGQSFQLHGGFSSSVGWNGLLIALAARINISVSVVLALVFGAMTAGGGLLGGDGVPVDMVNVMTAAVVVALLCPPVVLAAIRRARMRRAVEVAK